MKSIKSLQTSFQAKTALAAVFAILLSGCYFVQPKRQVIPEEIIFSYKIEVVPAEYQQVMSLQDSVLMSFFKDFTVYRFQTSRDVYQASPSDISNHPPGHIKTLVRYKYFVTRHDLPYGFEFDSLTSNTAKKRSTQTMLSKFLPFNPAMFVPANDSLLIQEAMPDGVLKERYIPKKKIDDTYPDTALYFYDRSLNNIRFALSTTVDSLKGMKLFKVVYKYNRIAKSASMTIPPREFVFEFRRALPSADTVVSKMADLIEKASRQFDRAIE